MQASDGTDAPQIVRPQHLSEVSFDSLPLHPTLKSGLAALGTDPANRKPGSTGGVPSAGWEIQ